MLGFSQSDGEAFPVKLPGVNKILSSKTIGKYFTAELNHYYAVYCNINRYGLPFNNWLDTPLWVLRLQELFDGVIREVGEYKNA